MSDEHKPTEAEQNREEKVPWEPEPPLLDAPAASVRAHRAAEMARHAVAAVKRSAWWDGFFIGAVVVVVVSIAADLLLGSSDHAD